MWRPDAHRDPYVWTAAFGGHLSVGVLLWLCFLWLGPWWAVAAAATAYSGWEWWSAHRWGLLFWDSTLDTVGVTLGAMTAAALWTQDWPQAVLGCAACIVIAYAGWRERTGPPSDGET